MIKNPEENRIKSKSQDGWCKYNEGERDGTQVAVFDILSLSTSR